MGLESQTGRKSGSIEIWIKMLLVLDFSWDMLPVAVINNYFHYQLMCVCDYFLD